MAEVIKSVGGGVIKCRNNITCQGGVCEVFYLG